MQTPKMSFHYFPFVALKQEIVEISSYPYTILGNLIEQHSKVYEFHVKYSEQIVSSFEVQDPFQVLHDESIDHTKRTLEK